MPDYQGLLTEITLPKYSGMTVQQIAASLTSTIAVPADTPIQSAFGILATSTTGDWSNVVLRSRATPGTDASTNTAISAAITASAVFGSGMTYMYTSQPSVLASLNTLMTALVTIGDISSASATAILALTTTNTTRAAQLGFGPNADMAQEIVAAQAIGAGNGV